MSRIAPFALLLLVLVTACSSGGVAPEDVVLGLEVAVDAGSACTPVGSSRSCACSVVGAFEVCQPSGRWSKCFCPPPNLDAGPSAPEVAVAVGDVLDAAVGSDRGILADAHDATPETAVDAAVGMDVAVAVADDVPPDVRPDVPVDTGPPPCESNTYRCGTYTGQPYVERCVEGAWRPWQGCGGYDLATNRSGVCPAGESTCQFCTGRECAAMCATDLECAMRGFGRCDRGRCLYRGTVACRTLDDCDVIGLGRTPVACALNGTRTEYVCAGSGWCTADAMCPSGWTCNRANGHCER